MDVQDEITAAMLIVGLAVLISTRWFAAARAWVQGMTGVVQAAQRAPAAGPAAPSAPSQPQSYGVQGTPGGLT
ncbi:MAG: hypothetical protein KGK07_13500 [Chloroflexota bacterium]|nr:hypothetical protein [Chloroflexota bacterium]